MNCIKLLKLTGIGLTFILLSACSTTGDNAASGEGEGSAQTMGLGAESGFAAKHKLAVYNSLSACQNKAPNDQSYYYAFNKFTIKPHALPCIDAQAQYLISHPKAKVLLTGNTDIRGSREYNIALGEKRALSVYYRLVRDGVRKTQMRYVSYGAEKPVALAHNEQAYQFNRRVDLIYEVK